MPGSQSFSIATAGCNFKCGFCQNWQISQANKKANDSETELRGIAEFLASIDTGMPWHISRFFPGYQYTDHAPTPVETMNTAYEIGRSAGLSHVYMGNMAGFSNDTLCPECGRILIRRGGMGADIHLDRHVRCPQCFHQPAGVFDI
ncbi:MAG: hypothetical protein SWH68_00315 [Thermodesulfobacteriota bacterium]|nr:hypothetical protein [Thermodesulfobacteriota bacterium]